MSKHRALIAFELLARQREGAGHEGHGRGEEEGTRRPKDPTRPTMSPHRSGFSSGGGAPRYAAESLGAAGEEYRGRVPDAKPKPPLCANLFTPTGDKKARSKFPTEMGRCSLPPGARPLLA